MEFLSRNIYWNNFKQMRSVIFRFSYLHISLLKKKITPSLETLRKMVALSQLSKKEKKRNQNTSINHIRNLHIT